MKGLTAEEEKYRAGQRTLRHYINKLQDALKMRRIMWMSTKAHGKHFKAAPSETPNGKRSSKRKKTLDLQEVCGVVDQNIQKPQGGTALYSVVSGRINHSSSKREPPKLERQNRALGRRKNSSPHASPSRSKKPLEPPHKVGSAKTLEYAGSKRRKSFQPDRWWSYKNASEKRIHIQQKRYEKQQASAESKSQSSKKCANFLSDNKLDHISEHRMLQRELVAVIDGRNIHFHLVDVDPTLLLHEYPTFTNEPMPSLIWPFD